jgi:phosphonopyruvate decarboxylase
LSVNRPIPPPPPPPPGPPALSRDEVVSTLLSASDAHVVATTGYLSRSLFTLGDRPQHFYMQGSMGHAAGFAFGVARARPHQQVVILDGDGAVLMHAGTLSTIGHFGPANLTHVVFDNGGYESTGGQPTAAAGTDLATMALASGYRHARRVRTAGELRAALDFARRAAGPTAVVVVGATSGPTGERASSSVDVGRLARRFARSLGADLPEPAR